MTPGFALILGIFALGISYLVCMAWSLLDRAVDTWRARRDLGAHFDSAVALGNAEGER